MTQRFATRTAHTVVALAVASALAACGGGGGGGSGGSGGSSSPQEFSGKAVDGLLAASVVSCVRAGVSKAVGLTGADGAFRTGPLACDSITVAGGVDVGLTPADDRDDVARPELVLRAPVSGSSTLMVTPVTTMIANLVDAGQTVQAASTAVTRSLDLGSANALTEDPVANAALFRAGNVVATITRVLTGMINQTAGAGDVERQRAVHDAVQRAVTAQMTAAGAPALSQPEAVAIGASSLMARIAQQAVANVQALPDAQLRAALADVKAETFAAVATPFVSIAARTIAAAGSAQDVVQASVAQSRDDRARATVAQLGAALRQTASATEVNAILAQMSQLALAQRADLPALAASITVGGVSFEVRVTAGLSDYVRIQNDSITLHGANGVTTNATLAQFESETAYPAVSGALQAVSFGFEQSAGGTQLSDKPRTVQVGLDVNDATRRLRAVIDQVQLSMDAQGELRVEVPAGAKMTVSGIDTARGIQATEEIRNVAANAIVSARAGQFTVDVDRLLDQIAANPAVSSPLRNLAASRLLQGRFNVTAAISDLRVGRASSTQLGLVEPARAVVVTVPGTAAAVAGMGVSGTIQVN